MEGWGHVYVGACEGTCVYMLAEARGQPLGCFSGASHLV